ncbi:MAG: hypothetical protein NWR72_02355, partial [Bacteroidia bacterium]|nr:hypothetical protein [Bacteroidia bacterium]
DLINDADADPLNEIQVLSQPSPNTIQLSKNGGTVTIPSYTPGPGITINGFQITNTGDLDGTDDVLIGSAAGGDLGGTYPNPTIGALQGIPIASFTPSVGQVLKYSSGQWMPSTDLVDDADADPSNELQALSQSGNQLALSNGGGVVTLFQAGTGISVAGNTITNSAPSPWLEAADTLRYLGGAVRLQTAGGATRTVLGIDAANNGYVNVYDNTNTLKAGFRITAGLGEVFGDAKNFRMTHPTDETKEIWYASLEGPEAAAYVRGTAHLVNGHCVVNFPEHFQLVASPQSMTVMLTPLSGESKGLAVIRKTAEGFEVTELSSGDGNYEFDWEVKCIRQGFEDYQVIREKIRD